MTYCGQHSLVNDEGAQRTIVSLRCRSWLCPNCYPDRRLRLIANAFGGRPNTFLTLTCKRTEDGNPEERAAALAHAWRILRKRAIREAARDTKKHPEPYGAAPPSGWRPHPHGPNRRRVSLDHGKLPFLAVVEKTELGWPHLHILLRSRWLDHEWLSAQMADLLDSPVVHVQRLNTKSARTSYCVKYCGKAAHRFASTKRYWQSRDYDAEYKKPEDDPTRPRPVWDRRQARIGWIVSRWLQHGWKVTFEGPYRATATEPEHRR